VSLVRQCNLDRARIDDAMRHRLKWFIHLWAYGLIQLIVVVVDDDVTVNFVS